MNTEQYLQNKINQIKSNLRNWRWYEWGILWGLVPAILLLIYSLPQSLKDNYFILDTAFPLRLQTYFLSSYTHSQLYPHLIGNLAFYFPALLAVFAFEYDRRRFWLVASWAFCIVPFISSFLTVGIWSIIGKNTIGQGFSAIIGAFLAYALFIFIIGFLHEILADLEHPETSILSKDWFRLMRVLVGALFTFLVITGILFAGGSLNNGPVHFGGFMTTLILLLIWDIKTDKKRYFDSILAFSIIIGILVYVICLVQVNRV